jgi:hypothetical protein
MGGESRRHRFRRVKICLLDLVGTKFPSDRPEILAERRIGATCDDCQRHGDAVRRQVAVNSARRSWFRELDMSVGARGHDVSQNHWRLLERGRTLMTSNNPRSHEGHRRNELPVRAS